ncbi:hypothetical protein [Paenibacillus sp. NFR01]|uniref:hypothetical protein n=1 Tax=Paenibacillus sp. NFR01 TaxID=1566279 RepID=UPI0008ACA9F1|nr:hypothetical protein [Paenibacillus sp. NFR01]SET66793.1 hypothetical protein SAMN03159358_2346 [Paenibacillus sp. NFR01]
MSKLGRKIAAVGIWAGIGILVGLQFGGSGGSGSASAALPQTGGLSASVNANEEVQLLPVAGSGKNGQPYMYVPVKIDPKTGAYTVVQPTPQQNTANPHGDLSQQGVADAGTENQPQQEVEGDSTLSPEQILIPDGQKPTVDVLADKTAGLLQQVSQKSIRWVVSLFDAAE